MCVCLFMILFVCLCVNILQNTWLDNVLNKDLQEINSYKIKVCDYDSDKPSKCSISKSRGKNPSSQIHYIDIM